MVATDIAKKSREMCDSCRDHLLAKNTELEKHGRESIANPPGRTRRFEQVKMIEREFYKMSDEDFKKAREDLAAMMQKYRE